MLASQGFAVLPLHLDVGSTWNRLEGVRGGKILQAFLGFGGPTAK